MAGASGAGAAAAGTWRCAGRGETDQGGDRPPRRRALEGAAAVRRSPAAPLFDAQSEITVGAGVVATAAEAAEGLMCAAARLYSPVLHGIAEMATARGALLWRAAGGDRGRDRGYGYFRRPGRVVRPRPYASGARRRSCGCGNGGGAGRSSPRRAPSLPGTAPITGSRRSTSARTSSPSEPRRRGLGAPRHVSPRRTDVDDRAGRAHGTGERPEGSAIPPPDVAARAASSTSLTWSRSSRAPCVSPAATASPCSTT